MFQRKLDNITNNIGNQSTGNRNYVLLRRPRTELPPNYGNVGFSDTENSIYFPNAKKINTNTAKLLEQFNKVKDMVMSNTIDCSNPNREDYSLAFADL